jgi:hypothetical protein
MAITQKWARQKLDGLKCVIGGFPAMRLGRYPVIGNPAKAGPRALNFDLPLTQLRDASGAGLSLGRTFLQWSESKKCASVRREMTLFACKLMVDSAQMRAELDKILGANFDLKKTKFHLPFRAKFNRHRRR